MKSIPSTHELESKFSSLLTSQNVACFAVMTCVPCVPHAQGISAVSFAYI
jgi:hypothetical protein